MQVLNPPAIELNDNIREVTPLVYSLMSELGKRIYLPKGILSQSAEATVKSDCINATRAIATQNNDLMHLKVSQHLISQLSTERIYGYPPVLGNLALRSEWQTHIRTKNPLLIDAPISLPIVTNGMTHGFSLLAELFADKGDVLMLPDMIWGNYRLIFETKTGADVLTYPFFNVNHQFNILGFRESLLNQNNNKLLLLLNFPHNPTGYSITRSEGEQIVDAIVACADTGCSILVMVDDAYAGFWYDSAVMHESVFGLLIGCHPNVVAIKIDGATKEEYAWGLRVGFVTFGLDENVMGYIEQKFSGLIRANTSGASQISQTLILETMKADGYAEQKQQNYEILNNRAMKVKQVATNVQYSDLWEVYPNHAGYFICLSLKLGNAEQVRQKLLNEHGIGTIALNDSELRVAYSCVEESDIEDVFSAIAHVIQTSQ